MTSDERWTAIFDRIALFLTLLGFVLREWVPGATAGSGLNLFIHLLFWIALTLWFAGRATGGGATYRFSGFEFAFLGFGVVALISVLRASYKIAALDQALTWLSFLLFFVLCVQVIGRRLLTTILLATAFTIALYAVIQYFFLFQTLQPVAAATNSIEMARRIRTNEPWGTFIGPNQLAAFLVLLLPLLAGSMIDAKDYKVRGPAIAVGLLALGLTGSLGGFVALGCAIVTIAGLYFTRQKNRATIVGIGAGAVAVAVGLLLWSPLLSTVAARSHSMHVRQVYWRATGPIIGSAPLLGVGFDNWQEHYFRTKSDVQQETRKTHNDYLQVLSETGIVGLIAFAGILVLGLRKAMTRESEPATEETLPSPWFVASVIALLILIGVLHGLEALSVLLGGAWLAAWLILRRSPTPSDLTWTRLGIAGGLVGFMVHMVVDFLIFDYGVAINLIAGLALIALLQGRFSTVRIPKPVCVAVTGVLMAIIVPLLTWITPRAMAADNELTDATLLLSDLDTGRAVNPSLAIVESIRVAESAQQHNPFNADAYRAYAKAKLYEWGLLRRAGARETKTLEATEGMMLQALENAIRLRPFSSPLHDEKAMAHLEFRRYYLKDGKNSELAAAKAAEHLRVAIEHRRRAYELYPTYANNAYQLARVLDLVHDPDAVEYYKQALHLSDMAGRELENLDRLKLDPVAQARALRAVGKPLVAFEILDKYFRGLIKGLPPEDAKDRLKRYVRAYEDELEEGMTPVLKDVVDGIMRDLK